MNYWLTVALRAFNSGRFIISRTVLFVEHLEPHVSRLLPIGGIAMISPSCDLAIRLCVGRNT
jgi:hypothetical protein